FVCELAHGAAIVHEGGPSPPAPLPRGGRGAISCSDDEGPGVGPAPWRLGRALTLRLRPPIGGLRSGFAGVGAPFAQGERKPALVRRYASRFRPLRRLRACCRERVYNADYRPRPG